MNLKTKKKAFGLCLQDQDFEPKTGRDPYFKPKKDSEQLKSYIQTSIPN